MKTQWNFEILISYVNNNQKQPKFYFFTNSYVELIIDKFAIIHRG